MACYLSTSCYGRMQVTDAVAHCRELSPYHIEISAPHNYQPLDELEIILREFKDEGINLTLHNYFPPPKKSFVLNMSATDKDVIQLTMDLVKGALRLSLASGSPLYGIHAGYLAGAQAGDDGMFIWNEKSRNSYEVALSQSTKFVSEYCKYYEEKGVKFLIENLFPSPKKQFSLFCTLAGIKEFMSLVPKSVGLLLDLGHLNISSNILKFNRQKFLDEFLDEFGSRLYEIHISENNGLKDEHLPIKEGSWQLDALKQIESIPLNDGIDRIYCLESRKAEEEELKNSLDLINTICS